jgi:hypothetical protein
MLYRTIPLPKHRTMSAYKGRETKAQQIWITGIECSSSVHKRFSHYKEPSVPIALEAGWVHELGLDTGFTKRRFPSTVDYSGGSGQVTEFSTSSVDYSGGSGQVTEFTPSSVDYSGGSGQVTEFSPSSVDYSGGSGQVTEFSPFIIL